MNAGHDNGRREDDRSGRREDRGAGSHAGHGSDGAHGHPPGSCREVLENLSCYLEGDLSAELRTAVETHLGQCADCRHCADEIRATILLIGDTGARPLAPARHAALLERLRTALDALG